VATDVIAFAVWQLICQDNAVNRIVLLTANDICCYSSLLVSSPKSLAGENYTLYNERKMEFSLIVRY